MGKPNKPTKVKPAFYAWYYERMKEICKEYGYNLLLHGSMDRDLDLVCVAWARETGDVNEMLKAVTDYLGGQLQKKEELGEAHFGPQGRLWYVINFQRAEKWNEYNDAQWYVDISVLPSLERTLVGFAEWLIERCYDPVKYHGEPNEQLWRQIDDMLDDPKQLSTEKLVKYFLKNEGYLESIKAKRK